MSVAAERGGLLREAALRGLRGLRPALADGLEAGRQAEYDSHREGR